MLSGQTRAFQLDAKLAADSVPVLQLTLCDLRAMDDRRWPWLLLVPRRGGVSEAHDLTPLDQAMLAFETNMVAEALKRVTACETINTAALGNVVRQLHVHVLARSTGDAGWPGPVWGLGIREPHAAGVLQRFGDDIRDAL